MPIRLLALDLDGTLLDRRGKISERNRSAIEKAREAGVRVAVVTGRRFRDSRPIALELGLDVPLIAHNGALTKHARTLRVRASLHEASLRNRSMRSDLVTHRSLGSTIPAHDAFRSFFTHRAMGSTIPSNEKQGPSPPLLRTGT